MYSYGQQHPAKQLSEISLCWNNGLVILKVCLCRGMWLASNDPIIHGILSTRSSRSLNLAAIAGTWFASGQRIGIPSKLRRTALKTSLLALITENSCAPKVWAMSKMVWRDPIYLQNIAFFTCIYCWSPRHKVWWGVSCDSVKTNLKILQRYTKCSPEHENYHIGEVLPPRSVLFLPYRHEAWKKQ